MPRFSSTTSYTGRKANQSQVGQSKFATTAEVSAGTIKDASISPSTLSGALEEINALFLEASGTDLTITQSPALQSAATTGVAPTGATGDVNLMVLQDGTIMEQFILGAGQTIISPRMAATVGLNIALDQVDNEGAEYNFGARANAKHAYTIGTSAAFFMEATIYIEDISGLEPLFMGFRKVEANNATLATYTDYVGLGLNAATSATNVVAIDEINGGGQTLTDTTDAWGGDAAAAVLKVLVSAAGVCTFQLNGVAVTTAPTVSFDTGDVVMPCIHFLNGSDVAGDIGLQTLKIGFQG
ncbi:MAG: hypothetical protein KAI88_05145 [Nitrosomonadaceae bacterium]|nr:hypothetical protein [Nitrosomonadaceae bacterium]